jgi:hypothetical protein
LCQQQLSTWVHNDRCRLGQRDVGPGIALLGGMDERGAEIEGSVQGGRLGEGAAPDTIPGLEDEAVQAARPQ